MRRFFTSIVHLYYINVNLFLKIPEREYQVLILIRFLTCFLLQKTQEKVGYLVCIFLIVLFNNLMVLLMFNPKMIQAQHL